MFILFEVIINVIFEWFFKVNYKRRLKRANVTLYVLHKWSKMYINAFPT